MSFLNEMLPETAEAYGQMRNSIFKDSFLDIKTKELIAIASSVLMRCQFCVDAHAQRAIAAGATKEEIAGNHFSCNVCCCWVADRVD